MTYLSGGFTYFINTSATTPYAAIGNITNHYLHIPDSQAHCTLIGTDGISAFSRTSSENSTP
ncbi:hypothetical protein [Prevotella sp.]|uniref:hypothetical protein n=1 Tax=Prevotella sp. TaxID=59823 RepID=UPI0027E2D4F7|nr:hypothetical protein [Prevotella sp.]